MEDAKKEAKEVQAKLASLLKAKMQEAQKERAAKKLAQAIADAKRT